MNKKRIGIILLIPALVLLLLCGLMRERNDAKTVFNLPSGFVSLDEEITSSEGALRYVFWESRISFLNADNICIYQTGVKNDDFIVKYNGNYYICEEKYNELLEAANG
ncbi:hypothetical protein [Papillibacter cinnamivorans]|uniref:Uncharacterized protein n=1 Tax=Papillibacter cinnamivorans DSM 12816 TaxID=1122930 RepID=A0A1W2BZP0_9FIRM|nr:hypothetical protein [Papillibacter cinnamivorans]SMC78467.1 hypothetical protein SAMN02745168_2479 [Papillibacter cinnamivorans DSM 12816]